MRDAAEAIPPTLTAIFNSSINTGIFPDDFKNAIISPIHISLEAKQIAISLSCRPLLKYLRD